MTKLDAPSAFVTPGGEELVVLSREAYDRLVELAEDALDVAAYDRAKAELAAGEDSLIPFPKESAGETT